jgi:hypothetical protein
MRHNRGFLAPLCRMRLQRSRQVLRGINSAVEDRVVVNGGDGESQSGSQEHLYPTTKATRSSQISKAHEMVPVHGERNIRSTSEVESFAQSYC